MRFFYDTEFLEAGPTKPITLLSIGAVADDGREFYRQSVDFELQDLMHNLFVFQHVFPRFRLCPAFSTKLNALYLGTNTYPPDGPHLLLTDLKEHIVHSHGACPDPACVWGTRVQIRRAIRAFMDPEQHGTPELWANYGAYDHVVFCQIFGTMMDLPKGFPYFSHDLQQYAARLGNPALPKPGKHEHNALEDAYWLKRAHAHLQAVEREQTRQRELDTVAAVSTGRLTYGPGPAPASPVPAKLVPTTAQLSTDTAPRTRVSAHRSPRKKKEKATA